MNITNTNNAASNFMLTSIPLEVMQTMLRQIVREEMESAQKKQLQDKFLSVKEACQVFQPAIRRETLNNWSNKGLIQKHIINKRVFFKYSELVEADRSLKKYRRVTSYA